MRGIVRSDTTKGTKGSVINTTRTNTAHVQRGVKRPVGKVKRKATPTGVSAIVVILVRSWTSWGVRATGNPKMSIAPSVTNASEKSRPIHSWDLRQKIRRPTTQYNTDTASVSVAKKPATAVTERCR